MNTSKEESDYFEDIILDQIISFTKNIKKNNMFHILCNEMNDTMLKNIADADYGWDSDKGHL